uniref:Zinc finger protein 271 n=2 Tax=Cacopsylla melanoneura TaxID=428564 RepID=A0A8D8QBE2_9HEMI
MKMETLYIMDCNNEDHTIPNTPEIQMNCQTKDNQRADVNENTTDLKSPQLHEKTSEYFCNVCTKSFLTKQYLKYHLQAHNGFRYYCNKCTASFTYKNSLRHHVRKHKGMRFTCDVCGNTFAQKGILNVHLKVHAGIRFPCDQCSKTFTRHNHLRRHLLNHKGSVNYPCGQCSKSFTQKGNLQRHLIKHTGVRYNCDYCSKSFSQKGQLTTHLSQHKGYYCEKCKKYFLSEEILKEHHQVKHAEKSFPCNHCTETFSEKKSLFNHLLSIVV